MKLSERVLRSRSERGSSAGEFACSMFEPPPDESGPLPRGYGQGRDAFARANDPWTSSLLTGSDPDTFMARAPMSTVGSFDALTLLERRSAIRRRIVELSAALFEEEGIRIDANSEAGLYRLTGHEPALPLPSIGAEATGRLIATWRPSVQEALTIRFIGADEFEYAFSERSPVDGRRILREWGSGTPTTFFREHPAARALARRTRS